MDSNRVMDESTSVTSPATYEAPRVESVLTADDLAREVQYAGNGTLIVG
jgi:hypothetical protein